MATERSERWLKVARRVPVDRGTGAAFLHDRTTDDVETGQVRQAYWSESAPIVVVMDVDRVAATIVAAPATLEPEVENRSAVVLEADASPIHASIAIWPGAAATIPFAVLDVTIASLSSTLLDQIIAADHAGVGVRTGHATPALGSGTALAIDELFDSFDVLQNAPGLQQKGAARTVSRLDIPLPVIMQALHIPQARAMAIRVGKEVLTSQEAERLAAAAGRGVGEILSAVAPLPDDLERELQEPRWRAQIRRRVVDGDEVAARLRLGYEAYQLAARETGRGQQQWRQRLEAVVATGG